ncbi:hypothetical protein GCM10028773_10450 [Spirosoma koreense]
MPSRTTDLFPSLQKKPDAASFNHDEYGQLVYRHLTYYSGTIDPLSFVPNLPKAKKDAFNAQFDARLKEVKQKGLSHDQIIDQLTQEGTFTGKEGEQIKRHNADLKAFLASQPDKKTTWDWFVAKEQEIINDKTLSEPEKSTLLIQRSMIKYVAMTQFDKLPQAAVSDKSGRLAATLDNCDFWDRTACILGYLSGVTGIGSAYGGSLGIAARSVEAATKATAVGAVIGVVLRAFAAYQGCNCTESQLNSCSPPITATFPFECYIPGTPLRITALGAGGPTSQYDFDVFYNNDENNKLYHNAAGSNYIDVPGDKIVNTGTTTVGLRISSYCNQQLQYSPVIGWIDLSTLGKPYFAIYGTDNMTVADVNNAPYYNYQINGAVDALAQAGNTVSIQWELIPSGYPNYSATGQFTGGSTGSLCQIRWDNHAGYATLKCTATTHCSANGQDTSIVQYFNVHIN